MEPMFMEAVLKQGVDMLRVYHDLYGYHRVNFTRQDGKHIVYFSGSVETGKMVKAYLEPLSDRIFFEIDV